MSITHRSYLAVVLAAMLAPMASGCGGSDDSQGQQPRPWETVEAPDVLPATAGTPTLVESRIEPINPDHTNSGRVLTCQIPEDPGAPALFAESNVHVEGTADQMCISQADQPADAYCRWVAAHEARFRAVADCHKRAVMLLDRYGRDAVDGELAPGETWESIKPRYVDGAWALAADEMTEAVGDHSARLAHLLGGEAATRVAASPLCFSKDPASSLRQARDLTLTWLRGLWLSRDAQVDWVLSSLTRGVLTLVDADHPAIDIRVEVVLVPYKQADEACYFERR